MVNGNSEFGVEVSTQSQQPTRKPGFMRRRSTLIVGGVILQLGALAIAYGVGVWRGRKAEASDHKMEAKIAAKAEAEAAEQAEAAKKAANG